MSYKALKKIINSLGNLPSGSVKVTVSASPPEGLIPTPDSDFEVDRHGSDSDQPGGGGTTPRLQQGTPREFQALKTAFFYRLERELEKVNTFYLGKEAELKVRLRTLVDKKKIMLLKRGGSVNAASLGNLREAFLQYVGELTKLQVGFGREVAMRELFLEANLRTSSTNPQKYIEINQTGFRKILKKWDKRSKSSTKELYLSRQVEIQPCFNKVSLESQVSLHKTCSYFLGPTGRHVGPDGHCRDPSR